MVNRILVQIFVHVFDTKITFRRSSLLIMHDKWPCALEIRFYMRCVFFFLFKCAGIPFFYLFISGCSWSWRAIYCSLKFPRIACADGLVDEISESLPKASRVNIRMGIVVGMVGCPSCSSNYCISLMGKTWWLVLFGAGLFTLVTSSAHINVPRLISRE